MHVCLVAQSCLLFAVPRTITCQVPLSTEFPRQEYWSGLPFSPPRNQPCLLSRPVVQDSTWKLPLSPSCVDSPFFHTNSPWFVTTTPQPLHWVAWEILVFDQGLNPYLRAWEAQILNLWTTREGPSLLFFILLSWTISSSSTRNKLVEPMSIWMYLYSLLTWKDKFDGIENFILKVISLRM